MVESIWLGFNLQCIITTSFIMFFCFLFFLEARHEPLILLRDVGGTALAIGYYNNNT